MDVEDIGLYVPPVLGVGVVGWTLGGHALVAGLAKLSGQVEVAGGWEGRVVGPVLWVVPLPSWEGRG